MFSSLLKTCHAIQQQQMTEKQFALLLIWEDYFWRVSKTHSDVAWQYIYIYGTCATILTVRL